MWATSRKCVFYGIFKNTTKHQKIFSETFFEMQPNTWKYFLFRKIAFPENIYFLEILLHEPNAEIFSGNTFTRTKRSLRNKNSGLLIKLLWPSYSGYTEDNFYILYSQYFFQTTYDRYLISKIRLVFSLTLYKFIVWACWAKTQFCLGFKPKLVLTQLIFDLLEILQTWKYNKNMQFNG